ncbi:MAG: WD40/YVTN/BNR-like repeat-containing protein, partial [Gaiellaceae bacterium]
MRSLKAVRNPVNLVVVVLALCATASPALAQWSLVPGVPAATFFSLTVTGDTLVAGSDTTVYLSTNAGANWGHTLRPDPAVGVIDAVLMHNRQLYIGTAGQGVFMSADLGATWQAFNQGLVGGIANSQLDVSDLVARGDSLYAATLGAGVYVRNLTSADTWHHFGEVFVPNQASNVNDLELGGVRLFACAGANGDSYYRDPGDAEWTQSF